MTSTEIAVPEGNNPLARLEQARAYLEESRDLTEVKAIKDLAAAAEAYARAQRLSEDAIKYARDINLRALRKMGELLQGMDLKAGRPKKVPEGNHSPTLSDLGITKKESWEAQRAAAIPEEKFDQMLAQDSINKQRLMMVGAPNNSQLVGMTGSNEWYTPSDVIEAARRVMGGIDLDPASCELANQTVKAGRYYTEADDGLAQPWFGRVFCNPPYGGLAGDFVKRMVEGYEAARIEAGILLLNANCIDAGWYQPLWDYTTCFTDYRLKFRAPGGETTGNTAGSAIVYLGPDWLKFGMEFKAHGRITTAFRPGEITWGAGLGE